MPIIRYSDQKTKTLEEFYSEWAASSEYGSSEIGKTMLTVIKLFNDLFPKTIIYGTTSHAHLILHSEDDVRHEWYVDIIANGQDYYIDYLMPIDKQPWPNARVKGEVNSFEEFKNYIIIAMSESGGWPHCEELKKLRQEIK